MTDTALLRQLHSSLPLFDRDAAADKANYVSLLSDLRAAFDRAPTKYGWCTQHMSRKDLTCAHRSDGNTPKLIPGPPGDLLLVHSCSGILTLYTVGL